MPKIEKLPSGSYRTRISYKENGKYKQKSIVGATKDEVRLLAAQFAPGGDVTVSRAIEQYLSAREGLLSPKTLAEYRKVAATRFEDLLNVPCERVTPRMFQSAVTAEAHKITRRGTPVSQKTLKNAVGLFGAAIKSVCPNFDHGKIVFPQKIPVRYNTPASDVLLQIYDLAEGTAIELPVLLASQCSLRLAEVMGLRWSDVHRDHIDIVQERMYVQGVGEIVKLPKTDTSTRKIRIPPTLSAVLEKHRRPDGYVVPNPYCTIETIYSRRIRSATGVKFHELRHAYVSHLISIGIPMDYIRPLGGWGKYSKIPDYIYNQILDDKEREFSEKSASYFDALNAKASKIQT